MHKTNVHLYKTKLQTRNCADFYHGRRADSMNMFIEYSSLCKKGVIFNEQ